MKHSAKVVILVKALPQPSKQYGETVCCAGITADRQWKRLFPIRFRHLSGTNSFKRWDWVKFDYRNPTRDIRSESCHVYEDSIELDRTLQPSERNSLIDPMIVNSGHAAAETGCSLALIRPTKTRFTWKEKSRTRINEERNAFNRAARQTSLFDSQLAEIEPTPFEFRFTFTDAAGEHNYENGDWEAHAMFWNGCQRDNVEKTLEWMDHTFNVEYPKRGMVFALGNQAKRPQTWQLLGVIRLDIVQQGQLF